MSTVKTNHIQRPKTDYTGSKSTLCTGCGHDSITNHIITAFFQLGVQPYDIAKMSGIGCSSKTPAYFLSKAHGFNSIHGRMAPMATGAKIANQNLTVIGVSGDGDSASIGLGGFAHLIRRNLPMIYIVENNGVYGLTKGQFSATSDTGARLKSGLENPFQEIDLCTMALSLGATFVARSFSGDAKQLVPLISAAAKHEGTAVIDVISPCVTFNNHEGSLKGYDTIRSTNEILQELGFIPAFAEKTVDYEPGSLTEVKMHDGSILTLKKLKEDDLDISDPLSAINTIEKSKKEGHFLTGLFHINSQKPSLTKTLSLPPHPLTEITEEQARPERKGFEEILNQFS